MGAVAMLALAVNVGVALMLYRYRSGDSNMRSVWLCSRNDAPGNIAVGAAALGVAAGAGRVARRRRGGADELSVSANCPTGFVT